MEWHQAVAQVRQHVVRISTPHGSGTGFLVSVSAASPVCVIATAAHVVGSAHLWEDPIRISHEASGKTALLHHDERGIFLESDNDTAALVFQRGQLPLPTMTLPLITEGKMSKVGVELGWLGFPAVSPADLCFFSGRVSARIEDDSAYLVDGVAINGVSGGPAFRCGDKNVVVVGVVSAYIPNRAAGIVLPGLSIVRGVYQFHELAKTFKNLEEAIQKQSPPPPAAVKGELAEQQNPADAKLRRG